MLKHACAVYKMEHYAKLRQENADTISCLCKVADLIKNFDYSKKQLVEIVNMASTQPTKEQYIKILCPGDKNSFSLAPLDDILDLSKSISDGDSEAIKSSFIHISKREFFFFNCSETSDLFI